MSTEQIERQLEHKHEVEDRKKHRDLIEQSMEDDWDYADLPHNVLINLHRK